MPALYVIFGLVLIALIVLAVLWYFLKGNKANVAPAADANDPGGAGNEEIDSLVREAERRLGASKQGDRLGNLPIFFLAGDTGSTKTSIMVNAGLEPELLAGLVYRDNTLVPTRTANLWFSRRTIFVEAGGRLLSEPARWTRLIRKLQPRSSVASQSAQAPRAVLVCYDVETFTRPGAQESATAAARNLRARLGEMSQAFGINLPVYVLFTKMDRLPFFTEYVRNLTKEEAGQVLGATIPMRDVRAGGVYGEEQTARLTADF
jgi:type VI secretion system protein ImpL